MENKVQKIIFVITKSNFGGAQKYVYEITSEMRCLGKEVLVIFGGNGELKSKLEVCGIKTISINELGRNFSFWGDLKSFWKLVKIFIKEKPDVIHLNSSKVGGIGALAGRISNTFSRNKAKIIFTIHGWAFNENRNWFSKLFIKKLYWITILLSHISIAVSKITMSDASKIPFFFLINKKVVVIKNAIKNIEFFDRKNARDFISTRIQKNISENDLIVGTLAELHEIKGLNYFMEATKILTARGIKLFAVVFGEGEERKNLEKLIRESKLENNFFLCGQIENAAKYLKGFDIYISSSLSEGLSLVLLEAKQTQIKIIATDVGGNKEALSGYKNCSIIQSKNSQQIADSIEIMAKNKIILEESSKNKFQEMIEKLLKIYSA